MAEIARSMGLSRQAVYRAIYSSPTGILMWADGRGKGVGMFLERVGTAYAASSYLSPQNEGTELVGGKA